MAYNNSSHINHRFIAAESENDWIVLHINMQLKSGNSSWDGKFIYYCAQHDESQRLFIVVYGHYHHGGSARYSYRLERMCQYKDAPLPAL